METQKQTEQKWQYSPKMEMYFFTLPDYAHLSVDVSFGIISYQGKNEYTEIAQFDRKTGDVTADVSTKDMFGTKTEPTITPQKITNNKDAFLKAPGLSNHARTLAHIIFEALE